MRLNLVANLRRLLQTQAVPMTVPVDASKLSILAYTGGFVQLESLPLPVVFDLSTTKAAPNVVFLYGHDRNKPVGHATSSLIESTSISVDGLLSIENEWSAEIKKAAATGFPWQASVGLLSENTEYVPEGKRVKVNGREFVGPCYVARDNMLREVSILTIGADPFTSVSLSASLGNAMNFEAWVRSLGFEVADITADQRTALQAQYDTMMAAGGPGTPEAPTPAAVAAEAAARRFLMAGWRPARGAGGGTGSGSGTGTGTGTATGTGTGTADDAATRYRQSMAAEMERIDSINRLGVQYDNPVVNGVSLTATAVREGWTTDRAHLEMLRNARPRNVQAGAGRTDGISPWRVLQASVAQTTRMRGVETHFTPQELDAANRQYRSRMSLQQLLYEAASLEGYTGGVNVRANLRTILQATFSTQNLVNILASTSNAYLLEGYTAVDETWRLIARRTRANDFKQFSSYRGVGGFTFEKIAATGQIPHGTMSEQSYANKVDTFAKMFAITRQDIYNDDLGAFTDVPRQLGRGGAIKFNKVFWTEFLENASSFYGAGHANVSTGVLGIAGLTAANTVFMTQTDGNGDLLLAKPKFLLTPVGLFPLAQSLYNQTGVVSGNTTPAPNDNPWAGAFQPITTPYLTDTSITGNSSIKYYLIADPADVPIIEAAFLEGQETPIVETADVDFNQLGIQMRGYFDFGVRKQDYRGVVQSSGA